MRFAKTFLSFGFLILLTCLLAACGSTSSTATSSTTSSYATGSPTTTPDTSATGPTATTGKYYSTPTTSTGNTGATTIKTATATIAGKAETILTNAQGMTLYYFTPDTKTTSACTGGCAGNWPPLLITGSITLTSTAPGTLTTFANTNGTQIQYNGHFLYTYAGDSASGQTNGQGVGGKWFVATTSLK